jgi:lysophospholipase L1-like esterase
MFWYEDEIKRLERDRLSIKYNPETIFYGSSSIRMWTSLYSDFQILKPVNLGFGGSTLAACVWFFERVMAPYQPKKFIIYAGDNDLGDERHPEEVFIFFQQLVARVNQRFGDIPCYFVSLKPSINRWNIVDRFKFTNGLIENEIGKYHPNWHFIDVFKEMVDPAGYPEKQYFLDDGLHLSENGYRLWKQVISYHIGLNS